MGAIKATIKGKGNCTAEQKNHLTRKPAKVILGRFIDNADGTITDLETKLMWAKEMHDSGCNGGKTIRWQDAIQHAKAVSLAGYSDWRLPQISELVSIVDFKQLSPAVYSVFPNTPCGYFWSATAYKSDSRGAWVVGFDTGRVNGDDKNEFFYVRYVRSIK